jgi:ATP-dependent DNA helicase PIF1
MKNESLKCKVLSGRMKDKIVFIGKMSITPSDSNTPIIFTRRQFPIVPSFAMTINKSQGQTFNFVGVDLSRNVFSHCQLYVACSHCKTYQTLKFQDSIVENMIKSIKTG